MNALFRSNFPRIHVNELFGTHNAAALKFRALAERVYKTGESAFLHEVEGETGTEQRVWFDLLLHPVRDDGGSIDGVVIVGTDVTRVVTGRRALDEQAERTRAAEARLTAPL